jgi:hypothetical protein
MLARVDAGRSVTRELSFFRDQSQNPARHRRGATPSRLPILKLDLKEGG